MLKPAIICKQKQSFAVTIEASYGINTFDRNVSLERVGSARELAQYAVRLVEN